MGPLLSAHLFRSTTHNPRCLGPRPLIRRHVKRGWSGFPGGAVSSKPPVWTVLQRTFSFPKGNLKYIKIAEFCHIPLSTLYYSLPFLRFRFFLPLVGLGLVDPTWPWGPKHLYAALLGVCTLTFEAVCGCPPASTTPQSSVSHLLLIYFLHCSQGNHPSYQYSKFPGTPFLHSLHLTFVTCLNLLSHLWSSRLACIVGKKLAWYTEL